MKKRAFTLVELLVVVAIIIVLVSLLLPTLSKAKQEAKNIKCIDNLRQIGIALNAYSAANAGTIIQEGYWYFTSTDPRTLGWALQCGWQERLVIGGYVKIPVGYTGSYFAAGSGIFMCPNHDPAFQNGDGTPNDQPPQVWGGNVNDTYGLNSYHEGKNLGAINPNRIWASDGYVTMSPDLQDPVQGNRWNCVYHRHIGAGYAYTRHDWNGSAYVETAHTSARGANYLFVGGYVERSAMYGHYAPYYGYYKLQNGSGLYASSPDQVPAPYNVWFSP